MRQIRYLDRRVLYGKSESGYKSESKIKASNHEEAYRDSRSQRPSIMVAIDVAYTAPINPAGVEPTISGAQAWAGLARKARLPQEFVPVVDVCDIHWDTEDAVACTVKFKDGDAVAHERVIHEICRLRPPYRLDYEIMDGSKATNIISTGPGLNGENELFLTFVFSWVHPDLTIGDDRIKQIELQHKEVTRNQSNS